MCETKYEQLIWVDANDREVGSGEKMDTHVKKQLHRAFSIFIWDPQQKKLLLQKRAFGKYHSGGLWTNTCCSHPRKGQTMEQSLRDRLKVELGLDLPLEIVSGKQSASVGAVAAQEAGSFCYFADFGLLAEHELDHVYLVEQCAETMTISPDPEEIAELKWVSLEELDRWMKTKPEEFTAWFSPAWTLARKLLV